VLNRSPRHEDVLKDGGIAPRILDLGTRRFVASFTPWSLVSWGKSPRYPLDRRLGGPQSRSGRGDEKNSQSLPGIEPLNPDRPTRSQSLYRATLAVFKTYGVWGIGVGVGAGGRQPHPHKIIISLENRPTVLKIEEDNKSQRLKERKSQGEADLNSQG
jgi:hypothetical protein